MSAGSRGKMITNLILFLFGDIGMNRIQTRVGCHGGAGQSGEIDIAEGAHGGARTDIAHLIVALSSLSDWRDITLNFTISNEISERNIIISSWPVFSS